MGLYRLWRQSDQKSFECDARDRQEAVHRFGSMLGETLTLTEGLAAPEYQMGLIPAEVTWTKPPDIPVWRAAAQRQQPTQRQLAALHAVQDVEEGRSSVLNRGDAEECDALGWVEAQPGGGYRLTPEGRAVIKAKQAR